MYDLFYSLLILKCFRAYGVVYVETYYHCNMHVQPHAKLALQQI